MEINLFIRLFCGVGGILLGLWLIIFREIIILSQINKALFVVKKLTLKQYLGEKRAKIFIVLMGIISILVGIFILIFGLNS